MTAFVSGIGLIVLSLCQPYHPEGWPVVMFLVGVGMATGGLIAGVL